MKVVEQNFSLQVSRSLPSSSCQRTGHFFLKDKVNTRVFSSLFSLIFFFQLRFYTEEANNGCSKQKRERRAFRRQILNMMYGIRVKGRERKKEEKLSLWLCCLKVSKWSKNRATAGAAPNNSHWKPVVILLLIYRKLSRLFTTISNFCLISPSDVESLSVSAAQSDVRSRLHIDV